MDQRGWAAQQQVVGSCVYPPGKNKHEEGARGYQRGGATRQQRSAYRLLLGVGPEKKSDNAR